MMRISINVKTRHKRPSVAQLTPLAYEVRVAEPPIDGRANDAVISALAKYFGIKRNKITIVAGHTRPNKTIELSD